VSALVVGCASTRTVDTTTSAFYDPESRAVRLETTGCEFASGRTGSAVAIGEGLLLTVAHLIVRADTVTAFVGGGHATPAEVAAVDLRRDLALLRVTGGAAPPIEMVSLEEGAAGVIVGGATSGTVSFEVRRVVELTIEEILGTDRHSRLGYELAAETKDGDSGAGAFDDAGRLVGIVFATGEDEETTWITASSELEDFVASVGATDTYPLCA
jgi:S1-C subfamily serine protease